MDALLYQQAQGRSRKGAALNYGAWKKMPHLDENSQKNYVRFQTIGKAAC